MVNRVGNVWGNDNLLDARLDAACLADHDVALLAFPPPTEMRRPLPFEQRAVADKSVMNPRDCIAEVIAAQVLVNFRRVLRIELGGVFALENDRVAGRSVVHSELEDITTLTVTLAVPAVCVIVAFTLSQFAFVSALRESFIFLAADFIFGVACRSSLR